MSENKVVTPVVSTSPAKPVNDGITWSNNIPDSLEVLDNELHAAFQLQSQSENESEFRPGYLVDAIVAQNKVTCRTNVALYERTIDKWQKATKYRKVGRDEVEAEFLKTRDGKMLAEKVKISTEYLEDHK